MKSREERCLIYTALLAVSAIAAALAGWKAALWTLLQMGLVMEGVYWLCRPLSRSLARTTEFDTEYRA
ncbi:hypothetical protein [Parahaliea mediterranea]|uniref:hypothetical protein n=1 Tax=Parahaliea mediterranea TaxID=651086 RepID=UPI000E2F2454|nr:hypothetical protein [Parahaliea mediterranea]